MYKSYDVNESLTRFFPTFNSISNSHAPLKSINIKNKSDKPWVTKGLPINQKWENQSKFVRSSTKNGWQLEIFIIISNIKFIGTRLFQIVSINKALRTLHYDSVLKDSTKTKKMWDNVNLIINKKRPSSNIDNLKVKDKNLQQTSSISIYEEEKINLSLCSSKRNRGLSTIRKYRH